jgi:hypothetical protein
MNLSKLIEMGANEWKAGDKHRFYFDETLLGDLINFRVNRYNTGNISSATLNGEPVSNSKAKGFLPFKFWFDVQAQKFFAQGGSPDAIKLAVDAINSKAGE